MGVTDTPFYLSFICHYLSLSVTDTGQDMTGREQ